jgi:hypothetical protein
MTYHPDLSDTTQIASGPLVRAIGWLSMAQPFARGDSPPAFVEKLRELCARWADSTQAMEWPVAGGPHRCEFCGTFMAAGNLGVPTDDVLYVVPEMVLHYVEAHGYGPPAGFAEAVMACPLPGTPEYSARVTRFVQRGPDIYESWRKKETGAESSGGFEFPIFSDAEVSWNALPEIGPLKVFRTIVLEHNVRIPERNIVALGPRPGATQVLAVRVAHYLSPREPATINWNATNDSGYHGGGPEDEIAALLSLLSGARLRAGCITRSFGDGDPLGTPMAIDALPTPQLSAPPPLRRILPRVLGRHPIKPDLLMGYNMLSADEAIALVRAAKLYRDAIWIAEPDPNSAWLMLVSALEVAAVQSRLADSNADEMLGELRPDLSAALKENGGPQLHARVAEAMVPLLGSTNRFIKFVLNCLPDEPPHRPPPAFQHKWSKTAMRATLDRVYELRSRALHAGVPFPLPMCSPPEATPDEGVPSEKPIGAVSIGSIVWTEKDIPIYLQTFEYIARGALLNWWGTLGAASQR